MKLSDLVLHTSSWIGIAHTQVRTVAHELRAAGLISSGGRGTGGAEMNADDKINLLLGVCGVEVAKRATDHVRVWRQLVRSDNSADDDRFAFTRAKTIKDFFIGLITQDLNGGALDVWLTETGDAFDRFEQLKASPRHKIVLDFYVDAFGLTITVSRIILDQQDDAALALKRAKIESIEVGFNQTFETFVESRKLQSKEYKAGSQLIRRLSAENLRGWGTCLTDDAT
jgi:hypothetical protein